MKPLPLLTILALAALTACTGPSYVRPQTTAAAEYGDWIECRNLRIYGVPSHDAVPFGAMLSDAKPVNVTQDDCMAQRGYTKTR